MLVRYLPLMSQALRQAGDLNSVEVMMASLGGHAGLGGHVVDDHDHGEDLDEEGEVEEILRKAREYAQLERRNGGDKREVDVSSDSDSEAGNGDSDDEDSDGDD